MAQVAHSPSIVGSIVGDIQKQRRESAKAKAKKLIEEYLKARDVASGILEQLEAELSAAGESPEGIREILEAA